MMDKADILNNGLIEQYLLGELNAKESLALEGIVLKDKDLKARLHTVESNFEALAFENAITPPKQVKTALMHAAKTSKTKVVALPKHTPFKNYLAIAASIAAVLLIGSIWMYMQLNDTKQQLQIAEEQNSNLFEDVNNLRENLETASVFFDLLNSPDTKQYIFKGNSLSPEAKIISYVNHTQKAVVINTAELPKLDNTHDYQMWADVEGEMIDMGVIKKDAKLLAMNYIDDAASLNVTIEPSGGSDHPTVSKLITNIYL